MQAHNRAATAKTTRGVIDMRMNRNEYKRLSEGLSAPSPSAKNVPAAFLVGGALCALAEGIKTLWLRGGLTESAASSLTSVCMIALGVLLTGLGLFASLARFAGAGTLVPITGFANSMASPALEFRTEGLITGTAVKMFSIAGPVLVFGITASVAYGAVLVLLSMI